MNRRLFAPWFLAEALVARLTSPPRDPHASDVDVRDAIYASRLFSFVQSAVAAVERAWMNSLARRFIEPVATAALARSNSDRIRMAGACAAVAAVTGLVLQTAATDAGPLRWILPLAVGVVAAGAAAAAEPIARAWEMKRRR
jgi:hypothetical protein